MKLTNKNIVQKILGNSSIILFLLVFTIFSVLSPQFFAVKNLVNILIQSSSLAIIAVGMTFVLLTAGIDLSVGSIMFVAGVISGKMVVAGTPLWIACLFVLFIGLAYGYLNAIFISRFKIIPFIVTLSTFYIGRGLGLFISETRVINLPESFLQIGSAKILGIPSPILILAIVIIIAHLVLTKTVFGRQIFALGNSIDKAKKAGLPVNKILISVYLICGFCAALGGLVALAQLGAISPTFGLQSEFMAIAAAVLGGTSLFGGKGNVFPGTLIGAVTIQSIQSGLVIVNANPYIYPMITGGVIFVIVFIDSVRNSTNTKSKWFSKPFRFKNLILILIIASFIMSCQTKKKRPTIGISFETLQTEYWVVSVEAIKAACEANGFYYIEAVANGDANRQFEQVNNFIALGVDGIVIAPKDANTIIPIIKASNIANIPIAIYNRLPAKNKGESTSIVADNYEITKNTVRYMCELAKAKRQKHKAMILIGDLGDINAVNRRKGFNDAIAKYPDVVELVSEVPTEWNQEKALAGVTNALQAHPDIDFIFSSSDFLFPSLISALKNVDKYHPIGHQRHLLLGGFDGDGYAYKMLKNKYLDADGVQDVFFECRAAVEAVVKKSKGEKVESIIVDPGFVIHQGNLNEKAKQMWGANMK